MTAAPQQILMVAREARLRRELIDRLDDHERWTLRQIVSIEELSTIADPIDGGVAVVSDAEARRAMNDRPLDLRRVFAQLRAIVVGESPSVADAVQWMRRGAWDVVDLSTNSPTLADRVGAAFEVNVDASAEREAMAETWSRLTRLTPRERQLLDEVIRGRSNKQIAALWQVSERTVANHRANLLEKMHAVNTADLVRMAVEARHDPLVPYLPSSPDAEPGRSAP